MAYVRHMTLTANTVQTFTVSGASANASAFEILNRNGAGEIYINHDGTASPADPTVGGNDLDVVPAAVGAAIQLKRSTSSQAAITVKVISPAATAISFRSIS
jgi:hypothetical protein